MNQRIMLSIKLMQEAMIKLLKEKSIYDVSVRELCDVAGINRSTFYKYFNNTFELLDSMEKDFLSNIEAYINKIDKSKENQFKQLSRMCVYLKNNIEFAKILLNNNINADFGDKLVSLATSNLAQSFVSLNPDAKYNSYLETFVISGCFNIIKKWINEGCELSANDMANFIIEVTMSLYK